MHKNILEPSPPTTQPVPSWLALDPLSRVEVTSESPDFPIDNAFAPSASAGWRANGTGPQTIRLLFDSPRSVGQVQLTFAEAEQERTQEFTLSWRDEHGNLREVCRQQWNLSPAGSVEEVENYTLNQERVHALELTIKPDLQFERAVATLRSWRVS